ncbi:hypothetical protein [Maridesulfovibrio sp.]|uniref:hypothetical protein n=1 Tax=Maridesulfovibrio sp. TaxID=2795000 RepID=UPI002A187280|nr:hypothetical protein [Maridesulfovibrio sp.]
MSSIDELAAYNQQRAQHVLDETGILNIWSDCGIRAELVGSMRMGLLMRHLDIDMHVYSDPFSIAAGFEAMSRLAQNPRVRHIEYTNLLDAEDQCLEWHAWYDAPDGDTWQIDMMQIHADSRYAGYFERVADAIRASLTPETRSAILGIKNEIPEGQKIMSIEVYQAVLRDGVRNFIDFMEWKKRIPAQEIIEWMP